jgi:predicted permease
MALGIGAATAIFSVVHGVVLDPFPYKDSHTLMSIAISEPGQRGFRTGYTVDQFLEFRERTSAIFSGVTASTISDVSWTGRAVPERLRGNHTTYDGLEIMGVPALMGRIFTSADSDADVCVLGFRYWQKQFGGDADAIGRQMLLNGKMRTVVGVMPPRFMWRGADVYVPLNFQHGTAQENVRNVHVVGRLRPGVTMAQSEATLKPIVDDLKKRAPRELPDRYRVSILSFADTFPSGISHVLWALFAAAALLLLIACANVSNLLLSQSLRRGREMAVRTALGARRGTLIRQLLTESLVIAGTGGVLGIALAWTAVKAILAAVPPFTIPDEAEVRLNVPVLAFAVVVTALTALLFGIMPALQGSRRQAADSLGEASRGASSGRRHGRLSGIFVVAEVALSVVLLTGAALMMRSMLAVNSFDFGVRTDGLLTARVPLSLPRYPETAQRARFTRQLLGLLRDSPGVKRVATNSGLHPFGNFAAPVAVPGIAEEKRVRIHSINPDYPGILGIALRRGRMLSEPDMTRAAHTALVNEVFARTYFPGREALGGVFRVPRFKEAPFRMESDAFEIVGVTADTLDASLRREPSPEVFIPHTLTGFANFGLILEPRAGDPIALARTVRETVTKIDRDQPVTEIDPIEAHLSRFVTAGPKFNAIMFGVFGFLGLVLAAVGIYGVIASSVARRTREIGIRMAMGATLGNVIQMILKQGIRLILAGIAVGLACAFALARYVSDLLAGMSPYDAPTASAGVAILTLTGLLACWLPARRAAKIDPANTLRAE